MGCVMGVRRSAHHVLVTLVLFKRKERCYQRKVSTDSQGTMHCNGSCLSHTRRRLASSGGPRRPLKRNMRLESTSKSVSGGLSQRLTSLRLQTNQAEHARGIDDPTTVTTRMRFLAQELATRVLASEESGAAVDLPISGQSRQLGVRVAPGRKERLKVPARTPEKLTWWCPMSPLSSHGSFLPFPFLLFRHCLPFYSCQLTAPFLFSLFIWHRSRVQGFKDHAVKS